MTPEQQDLLEKAARKLESAKVSLREGFPEDTASRAYYSMFYVAQSLLLNINFTGRSHRGVINAFGENLAMSGRVPREYHRLLIDAERMRERADYGPLGAVTPAQAQEQIARAERFLELGNRLIVQPAAQISQARVNPYTQQDLALPAQRQDEQTVRNLAAVYSARRLLDAVSKDTFETDEYILNRQAETVAIAAKDGRGEIARMIGEEATGNVSTADVSKLSQLEKAVLEQTQLQQQCQQPNRDVGIEQGD